MVITGGISEAIVGLLCVKEVHGQLSDLGPANFHRGGSVAQKLTRGEDSNSQITDGYRFIAST